MQFHETSIPGVFEIEIERLSDFRGFFTRIWCAKEFSAQGLMSAAVQASIAFNERKGTLRGMHFQTAPRRESRLVRCVNGAAFFAVVDLRPTHATFLEHTTTELSANNRRSLFVPAGVALGYQTLEDRTEILYHMDEYYEPTAAGGFRWNDPAFGIRWPEAERIILERDNEYPDFSPALVQGFADYP